MNRFSLFWIIFSIVVCVRIALAFSDRHPDVFYFSRWLDIYVQTVGSPFYELEFDNFGVVPANYPPLAMYLLLSGDFLFRVISSIIPGLLREDFYKLPLLICDLGFAWLIYRFFLTQGVAQFYAQFLSICYLVHPLTIYLHSWWGQLDFLPSMLVGAAVLMASRKEHVLNVVLLIWAAIMLKQTVVVVLPLVGLYLLFTFGFRNLLLPGFIALVLSYLVYLPFYPSSIPFFNPLTYYQRYSLSVSGMPYSSNNAFSFWYAWDGNFGRLADDVRIGLFTTTHLSYGLVTVLMAIICVAVWRKQFELQTVLVSLFCLSIGSFLLLAKMHERHSVLALPFLWLLYPFAKRSIFWLYFGCYSLFALWNLMYSWRPVFLFELPIFMQSAQVITFSIYSFGIVTFLFVYSIFRRI